MNLSYNQTVANIKPSGYHINVSAANTVISKIMTLPLYVSIHQTI